MLNLTLFIMLHLLLVFLAIIFVLANIGFVWIFKDYMIPTAFKFLSALGMGMVWILSIMLVVILVLSYPDLINELKETLACSIL